LTHMLALAHFGTLSATTGGQLYSDTRSYIGTQSVTHRELHRDTSQLHTARELYRDTSQLNTQRVI